MGGGDMSAESEADLFGEEAFAPQTNMRVWAVGALCHAITDVLDARFHTVRVRGEVAGWVRAASGHCYFTLKDAQGQLRCAMFRRAADGLGWLPREGDQVEAQARLTVYEARGDLQLVVESLRRAGQGELYETFLRIKAELAAQGLFDVARKRMLTPFPRGLGVVTSLEAAALRDVATTLQRRAPHVPVWLVHAPVQGVQAPVALMAALRRLYALCRAQTQKGRLAPADDAPVLDAILLVRGGGSLEDLWAFNDPQLAHTIVQSPVPVIVGVGHETDFTIADWCADVRAPTPTAAAELAAMPLHDALRQLQGLEVQLQRRMQHRLDAHAQQLDRLAWALARSAQPVQARRLHLHDLALRLQQNRRTGQAGRLRQLQHWQARLLRVGTRQGCQGQQALRLQQASLALQQHVWQSLQQQNSAWQILRQRWRQTLQETFNMQERRLQRCADRLQLLNPQQVLARGFAMLQDEAGRVLAHTADFHAGQTVQATVRDGKVALTVQGKAAMRKPGQEAAGE